ncbi:histone deacetylase [Paraferrimonas sp. SM1919]|uniref:histone deacetylase family protein n=1 Tax=Paraferrimonas sp. SM1919 TaxID=2662263 RepID=UPI0013D57061|nr:histone deacetylase [Paraferrimonas sp. SM1919]
MPLTLINHGIYSDLALPDGHRYPINKYQLLYQHIVQNVESNLYQIVKPEALTITQLTQVHQSQYIEQLCSGQLPAAKMRRIGFPWSEALIKRTLASAGGTVTTALKAMETGMAIHLSGGYHHAHYDFGSGFCLVNDLVLAANEALKHSDINKVLIIDSDVHHGDGTAALCAQREDIITLSFHCDKNFPSRKPQSDYDVGFAKGCGDEEFLQSFKGSCQLAIDFHQPDIIIYDAGVDIHIDDELGFMNITTEAIYQRDLWLLGYAKQRHIPIGCVVGGGYRTNESDLIPIHMQLIQAGLKVKAQQ